MAIDFYLNGERTHFDGDSDRLLLFVLRNDFGLLGSKFGCGLGLCGACMILMDQIPIYSCNTPMWAVADKSIETVEGLQADPAGERLIAAFEARQAFQCGYCTSGMLMASAAIVRQHRDLSAEELRSRLARNICRCGTHNRVLAAVTDFMEEGAHAE